MVMAKIELSKEQKAQLEATEMDLVEATRVVALMDEAGFDVTDYKARLEDVKRKRKFLMEEL